MFATTLSNDLSTKRTRSKLRTTYLAQCTKHNSKVINYTVCVPVRETHEKVINYTVKRPVYETHSKEVNYTVMTPVRETHEKVVNYTVMNRVMEAREQVINYTVMVPVTETKERTVNYTVTNPVNYTKTVTVNGGSWQTTSEEIAGPIVRKTVREPGTWTFDPSTCKNVYCPGACRVECVQCPPKTICKKVWVPSCETKEINCVRTSEAA